MPTALSNTPVLTAPVVQHVSPATPIIVRRPNRPHFREMSFQDLFDWHRAKQLGTEDAPRAEYAPKPPMTDAEFQREVYALVNAGTIRPEGGEKLLAGAARAKALRLTLNVPSPNVPSPNVSSGAGRIALDRHRALVSALTRAGVPEQFQNLRLDRNPFLTETGAAFDWSLDVGGVNLRAFTACRILAHSWRPGTRGLTLRSDGVGVGKTLIAYAVLAYVTAHHTGRSGNGRARCMAVKAKDILAYLRHSYGATWEKNPGIMSTEQVQQAYMFGPDVLLIDDLGKEIVRGGDAGEWARAELLELLDYRMDQKLTTILTTNLAEAEMRERYGAAFASRLLGRSPVFDMAGPDYRQAGYNDALEDPFGEA